MTRARSQKVPRGKFSLRGLATYVGQGVAEGQERTVKRSELCKRATDKKGKRSKKRKKADLGEVGKPARSLLACVWREVELGKCRGVVRKSKTGQREPGKHWDKAESGGDDTQPRRRWGSEYG
ncbi:hypothetical protein MCOR24_011051 [Pyricularia oryzae]|nr:hypothetical protein MCOR24_011051 [Pyricularia oryzae]